MFRVSVIPFHHCVLGGRLYQADAVRDNALSYHGHLRLLVQRLGGEIDTYDRLPPENADVVLAEDCAFDAPALLRAVRALGPSRILGVCHEPPGVVPLYYDAVYQTLFGRLLVPDARAADGCRVVYEGFPVAEPPDATADGSRTEFLCTIIGAKFQRFAGSLYDERIRAIRFFERAIPDRFHLYGQGWDEPRRLPALAPCRFFSSYRGACTSKHEVLAQHVFSLAYENSGDVPGYVTEKLFDCLMVGTIPVYLGAPDVHRHVPPDCFIDRRSFPSYRALLEYLGAMSGSEIEDRRARIAQYVETELHARLHTGYSETLLRHLREVAESLPMSPHPDALAFLDDMAALRRHWCARLARAIKIRIPLGNSRRRSLAHKLLRGAGPPLLRAIHTTLHLRKLCAMRSDD